MINDTQKFCPICLEAVAYTRTSLGSYWVHTATGHFRSVQPKNHDVNTYAPSGLKTAEDIHTDTAAN